MRAKKVLVARGAQNDPLCRNRVDALLSRIDTAEVEIVSDETIESTLRQFRRRDELQRGGLESRKVDKELVVLGLLGDQDEVFPGYSWRELRSGKREVGHGVLCHTAVEIQSVVGCPFDCTYCPYSSFICARVDVERFVDNVVGLVKERQHQSLYKLNNRSDTFGLEPEYDLCRSLVSRFATLQGKYLMLYSKGVEVDRLLDLDHRGKTVVSFTLTPDSIAAMLETGAPKPSDRMAAMAKLAAAGYPIRVRFSPIVPVHNYQEVYTDLVTRLAAAATPEMITLWTLSMVEIDSLDRIVPLESLDRSMVEAAQAAAAQMRGQKGAPFPPQARSQIYRDVAQIIREKLPTTQVSLCLEAAEVWDQAACNLVPRRGTNFLCNCGPRATPVALRRGHR